MYNGVINIYKEKGYTSFDVVAIVRKILKTKKVGHTGTLDPNATGVLLVCVGSATKLCDMLTDKSKEYIGVMRFGYDSDTQDIWGTLSKNEEADLSFDEERLRQVLKSFEGDIMQVPPMYSALKVNGQKLYDLARAGIEVERKARPITIDKIELLDFSKRDGELECTVKVACSKGTYIRTLIHDIGQSLGCGAIMTALERVRVGKHTVEEAVTLDDLRNILENESCLLDKTLIPVDIMLDEHPALTVSESGMKALLNGNILDLNVIGRHEAVLVDKMVYRIYSYDNQFYGLYSFNERIGALKPVKMFIPSAEV